MIPGLGRTDVVNRWTLVVILVKLANRGFQAALKRESGKILFERERKMKNKIIMIVPLTFIVLVAFVVLNLFKPAWKTNEIIATVNGTFKPEVYKSGKMFIIQESKDVLDYSFIIIPEERIVSIPGGSPLKVVFGMGLIARDLNIGVSIDNDVKIQSYHTHPIWKNRELSFVYGKNHFFIKLKKGI